MRHRDPRPRAIAPVQVQAKKTESHAVSLLLLHWSAGLLDGLSYLRNHVFAANMTGNIVLLGIHGTQGNVAAFRELESLLSYAAGALVAALLMLKREDRGENVRPIGFAAEFFLLVIFAALIIIQSRVHTAFVTNAVIVVPAMALAVQSVTVRRLRISGIVSTFITGTITTSMVGFARVLRRVKPSEQRVQEEQVALVLSMLGMYLAGAVCAALLNSRAAWLAVTAPAAVVAFVCAKSWRERR